MPTNTYIPLDQRTVTGSAVSSVTLNMGTTISQAYTDLRLVISGLTTVTGYAFTLGVNGDTGNNYSQTLLSGSGSSAQSARYANSSNTSMYLGGWVNGYDSGVPQAITVDFMNYSNTTTFKNMLWRSGSASRNSETGIILWRGSTGSAAQAITSININAQSGSNIAVGTTFALYGIAATSNVTGTAKATGGTISYDNYGYVYHTFTGTGNFVPSSNIANLEALIVAGGGGGGMIYGGGGGAGGLVYQSLTNVATTRTVTIGGGGSYEAGGIYSYVASTNGGPSSVTGFTTAIGGGRGRYVDFSGSSDGVTGGSGGGGSNPAGIGGDGTAGQGNSGATYLSDGGGGGGAGAAATSRNGGIGSNLFASWAAITSTGSSGYYAGGGAGGNGGTGGLGGGANGGSGGSGTQAPSGTSNTGGGGGGGGYVSGGNYGISGSGGSGIVILRYSGV